MEGQPSDEHKRAAETDLTPEAQSVKKTRQENEQPETPPPVEKSEESIRKQIEYYLSDQNLRRDRFFHSKISSDSEGWLDIKFILSCKKIQAMKATKEEILKALESSELETKVDGSDTAFVRRTTPPPALESDRRPKGPGGKPQKERKMPKSYPKSPGEIHMLGCILRVSAIPEEASWTIVRDALQAAVKKALNDADTKVSNIRHVSAVVPSGECFVLMREFANDREILEKLTTVDVNGIPTTVTLVDDVQTACKILDGLPPTIKNGREKDYNKLRTEWLTRPIDVGGTRFESIEHLKKCYRELLDVTAVDTTLKPNIYKVIRAVLDFHPEAQRKTNDVVAIKVAERTDLGEQGKPTKCFFVVRSDGTSEDFSMVRCIEALSRNPPFIQEGKTQKPTTTAEGNPEPGEGIKKDEETAEPCEA